jgi:NADP-dependent 3-hydroxy acid dehydrogenase YdfG
VESQATGRDRVVVITGAGSGIGAETARAVARGGGSVVLAGRRLEALEGVARTLPSPAGALVVSADVTRRAEVEGIAARAIERFGRVDVWINNAGRGITRSVEQITDDDLDAMMRDNVKSALYGMQTILPHFKERREGHIVNVSSMLGRAPFVGFRSAYSASKHALNSLTENLRGDLAKDFPEIVVTCVLPGVVTTDFGLRSLHGGPDSRSFPGAQSAEQVAAILVEAIDERSNGDVYTQPDGLERVLQYLRGLATTKPVA